MSETQQWDGSIWKLGWASRIGGDDIILNVDEMREKWSCP